MKNESNLKNIIPIVIIIALIIGVIYIPKLLKKNNEDFDFGVHESISKDKYDVNEYIPVYVDDKQMSRIYLRDYVRNVLNDIDSSYDLINDKYRMDKFGSIDKYKEYINSLNLSMLIDIDKYSTYDRRGYKYYDMYDMDGHRFIFRTNGVMQYEVLFDDYKFN